MRTPHTLNNPFVNRFDDPVSRRQDEMQSDAYMDWLRERNQFNVHSHHNVKQAFVREPTRFGRLFAGVFGLLVLIVSFALLLKVV